MSVLLDGKADAGLMGEFVERRREPAARRIAHGAQARAGRRDHGGDETVQRGGVRQDRRLELQILALRHDRDAVIARWFPR